MLDNAAAESTSTPQTLTQDEYVQEQLDRLKDNSNSNKKMGDIWKAQEEVQKKTNLKLKRLRNSGTMNTEPIITMILMEVTDL